MSTRIRKTCGVALTLGLIFLPILTAVATSRPGRPNPRDGSQRGGFLRYSTDVNGLEFDLAGSNQPDDLRAKALRQMRAAVQGRSSAPSAWMLRSPVFNQLSGAGRSAALRLNNRIPIPVASASIAQAGKIVVSDASPGANIRVNDPSLDQTGHIQSETSIIVNGNKIVESFNDFSRIDTGSTSGYSVSTDGGSTFTHRRIPPPPGGFSEGDGVVAFDPNGNLYYSSIILSPLSGGAFKGAIGVSKSTDDGQTFSLPVEASGPLGQSTTSAFQDKPWLAVDTGAASPKQGNIYESWTDFVISPFASSGSFIAFSRSTDHGMTFSTPINLSPKDGTFEVQGSMPAIAADGTLYVAYSDAHNAPGAVSVVKSTDGGVSFSQPTQVLSLLPIGAQTGGNGVRANGFPHVAVDPSGGIHVVVAAVSADFAPDTGDIFYTRSTDTGATWNTPVKVNDDGTTTAQFNPSIAASADGTIAIQWWDRRNDPVHDSLTDDYMVFSTDGGATFTKNFRVTDHNWVFSPIDDPAASGYHGDYDSITSSGTNFYLSWSDERAGNQDAFFATIPESRDPNLPDFNVSATKLDDALLPGNFASFGLSTSATNGFAGSLALSSPAAIPGLTVSFDQDSVTAGTGATVFVAASPTAAPGSYLIPIEAAGTGLTRQTNLRVTVYDPNRPIGLPHNGSDTPGNSFLTSGLQSDASGNLSIVYDDDSAVGAGLSGVQVLYQRSTDGGVTWSTPVKISGSEQIAFDSTAALGPNGTIYAAYTEFDPSSGDFFVKFVTSTDSGATFSAPRAITTVDQGADFAEIGVDKNNNVIVTYYDFQNFPERIDAVRSTDGGATFSAPTMISSDKEIVFGITNPTVPASVAFDSKGAAYVLYNSVLFPGGFGQPPSNPGDYIAIAADGQHFGAPTLVSNSNNFTFAANVAVDKNDNVFVTYYNRLVGSGGAFNREVIVRESSNAGQTFGPEKNLSNNAGQSLFPHLIADSSGGMSVVWEDTTGNNQRDIFYSNSTDSGATFSAPVNISANSGVSFNACGAADANGNIYVGWADDSSANPDIYVAAAPDFSLGLASPVVSASRRTSGTITVNVNRTTGFVAPVTVTFADTLSFKVKLKPATPQTTTGDSISQKYKVKGGAVVGPHPLVVTGSGGGRTRTQSFVFSVQ